MEKFFVGRPIFAIVIAIVIVLLGVLSVGSLPVEQYPDITPPLVEVSASYQGADAVTVNDAVATPVASSVMGVSDMLYMQATSANDGSMSLQVTFGVGSDPDLDAILTQNRVSSATPLLPAPVITQGVTTEKTMSGFLMVFSLYSDGRYGPDFLSNYAMINLQNELLKIDGVGKVTIMGAGEYSMRVWVDPDRMNYYGITVADIRSVIEAQGGIYPAGSLGAEPTSPQTQFTYTVTMPPQINTAKQYGQIVVKTLASGQRITLDEIATVNLGTRDYGVSSTYEGHPSAMIVVYQTPGSNAVSVGGKVKTSIQTLARNFPDGIRYETVVDTTSSITEGIRDIYTTLLIALVLVILIIYLFIQDVRATVIPLIAIPVSIVGAFMLFPLLGFSVNIISLLGLVLAIGLVVDDAIVVVEAVQVNIAKGMNPREATLDAMRSVAPPIVATTVVLLAVFIPVSLIGGISGRLYQQFSISIAVSVVISAFNALTLSPALCALLLRKKPEKTHGFFGAFNRWFNRRMAGYTRATQSVLRRGWRVLILLAVIGLAIFGISRMLPGGFLPQEDQGYIMVMVNLPEASALSRTEGVMAQAAEVIRRHPAVQHVAGAAGFNMMAGIASTSSGILFVTLKPYSDRKTSAGELAQQLDGELYYALSEADAYAFEPPSIPGLGITSGVSVMVQDRQGRGIPYLAEQVSRFIAEAEKLPEVASATTQFDLDVPQRRLVIDRDYALDEGVSLEALYDMISAYMGGAYVNNFNRFGKLYQTYIQAAPAFRQDKEALDSFFVTNGNGQSVPVSAFVSVIDTVGVEYVSQFNLYTSVAVDVTPRSGYSTRQTMDALSDMASKNLPDDIGIAWSGVSYQEQAAASKSYMSYLLALVFVFLALSALYNSWTLPLSILLGVPLAIFGAMLFVWGAHLIRPVFVDNIFMQISLIMLIGLAAKNAILIIEYAQRLFNEQGLSLRDAAVGAAKLRVRPILMTAFAFILGVLPLVFASGAYSTARNVMGVALVGGMGIATILGIFVYPALYYVMGRMSRMERKRDRRLAETGAATGAAQKPEERP